MDSHLLAFIGILTLIFGVSYTIVKSSHELKKAMIEAGMNPNDNKKRNHGMLRFALLVTLVPIGVLVGRVVHEFFNLKPSTSGCIFAFIFGGIGLLITYLIEAFFLKNGKND